MYIIIIFMINMINMIVMIKMIVPPTEIKKLYYIPHHSQREILQPGGP